MQALRKNETVIKTVFMNMRRHTYKDGQNLEENI